MDESNFYCYFCHKPVSDDEFCYGCQEHVCDECDRALPTGPHDPEDHK